MERCLHRALEFLRSRQKAWGEFAAAQFHSAALEGTGKFDSATFPTACVLHALSFVDSPLATGMRRAGRTFLEGEADNRGLWRYWSSRQGWSLDPDLDSTCSTAFVLWGAQHSHRSSAPNLEAILNNRDELGRFQTWVREPGSPNDVDDVVNANVLFYLGERAETAAAREFLNDAILHDREVTRAQYYVDVLALYYAVSRAFHHGVTGFRACREALCRKTLHRLESGKPAGLNTALAMCTLINFGQADTAYIQRARERLREAQAEDGSWPRSALYGAPPPAKRHGVWWGSEELTTAFCLEALVRSDRSGGGHHEQRDHLSS